MRLNPIPLLYTGYLDLYEQKTIKKTNNSAYTVNYLAENYFYRLFKDGSYRQKSYRQSSSTLDDRESVKIK